MPSSPLGSKNCRTASGVAFHRRPWTANQSNDVGHGMPSSPLGVSCYHRLSAAQTVRRCRAWHAITALGQHTRSDDIRRGMKSLPFDNTHGRTTSGLTCHHPLWTAHTVGLRRAWNDITALIQHTRSNDVWRGMTSLPLDCTQSRTMSGMACHHRLWAAPMVK